MKTTLLAAAQAYVRAHGALANTQRVAEWTTDRLREHDTDHNRASHAAAETMLVQAEKVVMEATRDLREAARE